jgi:PIN domain nuclease of toxin-antitoxin system
MARYLLDSNAFIRSKEIPQALRPQAREAIEDTSNQLFVSLASLWELAIKAAKGKLPVYARMISRGAEGLHATLAESGLQLLSIELHHAVTAAALPHHHSDPFDRIMIAQAIEERLILISTDRTLPRYAGLQVLRA